MCLGYRHLWRLGRNVGLEGVSMNESAFPWSIDNGEKIVGNKGMTLRDYFAAKAMQPLIVSFTIQDINWTAEQAYKIADAMIKARQQ
jgi:hypothetical protein